MVQEQTELIKSMKEIIVRQTIQIKSLEHSQLGIATTYYVVSVHRREAYNNILIIIWFISNYLQSWSPKIMARGFRSFEDKEVKRIARNKSQNIYDEKKRKNKDNTAPVNLVNMMIDL